MSSMTNITGQSIAAVSNSVTKNGAKNTVIGAGIFVGVVGRNSAESVAYFLLSVIQPRFAVCVIFVVSCFVSTAMGTSVGTITLITPIAVALSTASG